MISFYAKRPEIVLDLKAFNNQWTVFLYRVEQPLFNIPSNYLDDFLYSRINFELVQFIQLVQTKIFLIDGVNQYKILHLVSHLEYVLALI